MTRGWIGAGAVLAAGWAATFWIAPFHDESVTDVPLYSAYAQLFLHGSLPFRDVAFEYPPLAAPVLAVAGVAGGESAYRVAFGLVMLAFAVAMVALCATLARRTGATGVWVALTSAASPLLLGATVRTHFDLVPVVFTLGALVLLCAERPRAGLGVLGVGVAVKLYPVVVVPVALAWLVARGRRRAAWEGAAVFVVVVAVAYGAASALSVSGTADSLTYHVDRAVQVESTPALVLRGLDGLGLGTATPDDGHRSDGLDHPASGVVTAAFALAMAAVIAALALGAARRRGGRVPDERALVLGALAATAAFAAFGKVLSPQYLIWMLPLLALAVGWRRPALALACGLAVVLTQVEFPAHYRAVVDDRAWAVALVAARDAALLAVVALALRELRPQVAPARSPARWRWPGRSRRPRPAPR